MSVPSNTYVVSGPAETKKMEDLLPGILNQLGPESMDRLRDFATSQYGASAGAGAGAADEEEEDDDDVPDLVENFEVRFVCCGPAHDCTPLTHAHRNSPPPHGRRRQRSNVAGFPTFLRPFFAFFVVLCRPRSLSTLTIMKEREAT